MPPSLNDQDRLVAAATSYIRAILTDGSIDAFGRRRFEMAIDGARGTRPGHIIAYLAEILTAGDEVARCDAAILAAQDVSAKRVAEQDKADALQWLEKQRDMLATR